MTQSENVKSLLGALTKAQAEFVTLPKDKTGYGYKYTDLDTVITTVRPILARHGLGFMQSLTTQDGKNALATRLFNAEGEYIEDTVQLPEIAMAKTNAAQNMGAAITYMKRYALCALLGISSDEDTDAATPQNQESPSPAKKEAPAPKAPPALKGGPDTKDEHEAINALLAANKPDGSPVFEKAFVKNLPELRRNMTAQEVIAEMRKTIASFQQTAPATTQSEMIF